MKIDHSINSIQKQADIPLLSNPLPPAQKPTNLPYSLHEPKAKKKKHTHTHHTCETTLPLAVFCS